jgi:hypothetical protein
MEVFFEDDVGSKESVLKVEDRQQILLIWVKVFMSTGTNPYQIRLSALASIMSTLHRSLLIEEYKEKETFINDSVLARHHCELVRATRY